MRRVMISCPSLGRPVPTIQRMRPEAFATIGGRFAFRCACGDIHHWRKEDAWLESAAVAAA